MARAKDQTLHWDNLKKDLLVWCVTNPPFRARQQTTPGFYPDQPRQTHDRVMLWHIWSHPRQASATLVPGRSAGRAYPPLVKVPQLLQEVLASNSSHNGRVPASEVVCRRFNAGGCHRTDCSYLHKCSVTGCGAAHPANTCPRTPLVAT